jgi:hypothetical protein
MSKLCKYHWVSGSFLDGVKPWMAADLSTSQKTSGDVYIYINICFWCHTQWWPGHRNWRNAQGINSTGNPACFVNWPYILVSTKYSTVVIFHPSLVFDSAGPGSFSVSWLHAVSITHRLPYFQYPWKSNPAICRQGRPQPWKEDNADMLYVHKMNEINS